MLAQFALTVFALFAVLSLVIDVGYARLTQGQMQNAADAAALAGLRKRDIGVLNPATGQTVDDPFASDCLRRTEANRLVHWVFDDDFDVTNGDPDYQFGAGPILDLTGGVTNLHAGDTISVPDSHVYKPDLQLNQQNAVYGDMVSGRFCYSADPAASEGLRYADPETIVCTGPQSGSGLYARNDFNPNSAPPQPPVALPSCPPADQPPPDPWPLPSPGPTLTGPADSAFLVRLRRSNELQDFGLQTEPDVATSGPSLPLVFGRGTTIFGDDPTSAYSVRRDGLTIRATAIAEIRPALHVGLPQLNPPLPGVTPFALVDTFVQALNAVGCPVTVTPALGTIVSGDGGPATCPAAGAAVGRFVDNPAAPIVSRWIAVSTVGRALPAAVPTAACAALATPAVSGLFSGYGPVYSLMTSGTNRIIGFTGIGLSLDPCPPPPPPGDPVTFTAVISRRVSLVAASNATAVLTGGLPLPATSQPADVTELLARNCPPLPQVPACRAVGVVGVVNYAPVLAPVLAR